MKRYNTDDLYLLRLCVKIGEYWDNKEATGVSTYKNIDKYFIGYKKNNVYSSYDEYYIFEKGLDVKSDSSAPGDYKIAYGSNNIYKLSYVLRDKLPKKLSELEILDYQDKINKASASSKEEKQNDSIEKA